MMKAMLDSLGYLGEWRDALRKTLADCDHVDEVTLGISDRVGYAPSMAVNSTEISAIAQTSYAKIRTGTGLASGADVRLRFREYHR